MDQSRFLNRTTFGNPINFGKIISRDEAIELLESWVPNEKLRLHMFQVGHLMKNWAESKNYDDLTCKKWELAGLLHDADWEKWPDLHCAKIIEYLEEKNLDPEIIRTIACHGPNHFGVNPETEMEKMIYAFDELSGFVHAYSLMRPTKYDGMEVSSVKKKLKDKMFAQQVSREEIDDAVSRTGMSIDEIIKFVIENQKNVSL
ncbi:MAG: hydrolase [Patescibacteria group bacterium]